ncbi:hypothetical protein E1956_41565 [Paraburkholderia pallida]|uniref:Herpesvirus glycoprotein D/GG/GX domain-containing protein n=1 Tax=Paraburkholderia pallida TaxID=2547399 RepID=A0A4V1B0Q6_9BURK|nr:hypothetical protein E1956_41565 [Paraburkholderia pallida]
MRIVASAAAGSWRRHCAQASCHDISRSPGRRASSAWHTCSTACQSPAYRRSRTRCSGKAGSIIGSICQARSKAFWRNLSVASSAWPDNAHAISQCRRASFG